MLQISKNKKDKEFIHREGDAEIYFRIIPKSVRDSILRKHTKRGVTDFIRVSDESAVYAITGWNNKVVADGAPFEYSAENVLELPDRIRAEILEQAAELPADAEEREVKN